MDAYPTDYITHNLPLILLSGFANNEYDDDSLGAEYPLLDQKGTVVASDFPLLNGPLVDDLRSAFLDYDASESCWRAADAGRSPRLATKIKVIGRTYRLPPHKAGFPSDADITLSSGIPVVHSPISPLTPGSPTFPDGLVTPSWVLKHQHLVPAAVVNILPITSDSSMSMLRDNQLKIEIRGLNEAWAASGYKSRFVVVLVAEDGVNTQELDERMANIRRATNIDPRSLYVLYPDLSAVEVKDFVRSLLSSLHPSLVDYYRDLSKHARRKRNRGSIPPPTAPPTSGTSQTLSSQGWNVRYEFKLGVFAEFRQEMEAAQRNFEAAYEILFGQEVFESIAAWHPRFNEARLLGDILAIRIIRCLLWSCQTTAAVRFWINHRTNTEDIVHRKGKGTKNYGWEAWDSRWSTVMSELISRAELPSFSPDVLRDPARVYESIFHPPEKKFPISEGLLPWELLHHEGYWLDRSAQHLIQRQALAEKIPEEHRSSTNQSPASQVVAKLQFYDIYLVPEPHIEAPNTDSSGFDHYSAIIDTLKTSLGHFAARGQVRKVESLSLEIAKCHIGRGQWIDAYETLKPLWPSLTWRKSGWWDLMDEFAWTLRACAIELNDYETLIWIYWELLCEVFHPRPTWNYDFHHCLDGITTSDHKPSLVLKADDVITCLSASLVFERSEGNVGEPLKAQLSIESLAQRDSAPIKLSEVKIIFEGNLRPIRLQTENSDSEDDNPKCRISDVTLHDIKEPTESSSFSSSIVGKVDLTLRPSHTRVFNLTIVPREAGEARIASITLVVKEEKFNLSYVIPNDHQSMYFFWWKNTPQGPRKRRIGKERDTSMCRILPKPPKIHIHTPNLEKYYYTNERVALTVAMQNNEEDVAEVAMHAKIYSQPGSEVELSWLDNADPVDSTEENIPHSISRNVGKLAPASTSEVQLVLSNTVNAVKYELEISMLYFLSSDPQTPISKSIVVDLDFVRPFEANYDFLPRIHPQPWPNLFSLNEALATSDTPRPDGLQQKWIVNSKLVSFASEPLDIEKVSLVLLETHGRAVCELSTETLMTPETPQIKLGDLRESEFEVNVHKLSLEDRQSVTLDLSLDVHWRRTLSDGTGTSTVSSLAMPRFLIPMGEPRILASSVSSDQLPGLIHLDYTIENPSIHCLTFNLTMEASEHFAFSGSKTRAIQLVPLSRHTVRYSLLAFNPGMWIQPQLVVIDTYFNKTLRVLPTEGMRSDRKGILVWVDADGS
ncbi:Gryzun, putative trafficking through golgi-domain-containing protein [Talaromyces proteolyticus]|uniref:Gryzun, putative trafficking through golgi-domain-containing protein n=1 Tax=Talaromyces proteolyticus TaxID=1131652 RepID=A0AAD4KPE7_9EURO|nr:Gryzun, putative trafficking through golgi-domain-containing protein [Talaromyces proteolyticus]KAH8693051.1 Gryzun, putative trafficking through golgi-domain-containing protein [Talaromyces proteolyticus]